MLYDRVIVVGTGSIACKCTKILCELTKKENIFVVEYCENDISILCYWCKENEIEYYVGNKASNIEQYLKNIIGEYDALIISVNNLHIFSKDIVNSENVRIANFHYSLLPRYRGCNIPTWVVYNGECNTGVTWHFVGNKIDCGKIIAQKKIEIHESTTAQNIIKEGMKVGIELFASSIEQILSKNVDLEEENQVLEKIYKKDELPNNGYLDIETNIVQIARTLRAYDYGRAEIIPQLKVVWNNCTYQVCKYMITSHEHEVTRNIHKEEMCLVIVEAKTKIVIKLKESK